MKDGRIAGKLAKNNFQIEVRIYGSTVEDCAALLQHMLDELQERPVEQYVATNSGVMSHAGGYLCLQHDPGFEFVGAGSAFHNWLKAEFPGYDPDADDPGEYPERRSARCNCAVEYREDE